MSYFEGFKQLVGTVCGSVAGAAITGVDLAKRLGEKSTEILFYICGGSFIALGILTGRGKNQPPAQVAPPPPPPGQHAPAANKARRAPGPNRPAAPGGDQNGGRRGAAGRRAAMIQTPDGVAHISFAHDDFDDDDYYYEEDSSFEENSII